MLFEDIMFLAMLGAAIFLIGIPIYKFVRAVVPKKRNSLAEAKERLEQARVDVEAARLHKEAEKLYDQMYEEALQEDETQNQTGDKR